MTAARFSAAMALLLALKVSAFEGSIRATLNQGGESADLLYSIAAGQLRVERVETNLPHAVNLVRMDDGEVTLVYPQNRGFVRLSNKPAAASAAVPPGFPQPPSGPPGLGATPAPASPPGAGQAFAAVAPPMQGGAGWPAGSVRPPPRTEPLELKETGQTTNLLGFDCKRFELKQRGTTMEIWATEQLFPFQVYTETQPNRLAARFIENRWPELLKARNLFPLLATLKSDNGNERLRFEVVSISPQQFKDEDMKLFLPPAGYVELKPLPF